MGADSFLAYKREKEKFVSGLTGTTMSEINVLLMVIPATMWLHNEILTLLDILVQRKTNDTKHRLRVYLLDFALLVLPMIVSCAFTWLSSVIIVFSVATSLALEVLIRAKASKSQRTTSRTARLHCLSSRRARSITYYRAGMMLLTCVTILAVDFTVFPRRLAKAESFGQGLMDLGVGAVIIAGGLSSRSITSQISTKRSTSMQLQRLFISQIPILLMGVLRLLTTKGIEYQEHVEEYGVHWNFFFTVSAVNLIHALLYLISPAMTGIVPGVVMLAGYQYLLSYHGLDRYIMNAPRDNLFSQNREGILQTIGFLSIYMISSDISKWIYQARSRSAVQSVTLKPVKQLAVLVVLLWTLTYLSQQHISKVSRRMGNITFVCWTCAQCFTLLLFLQALDYFVYEPKVSVLLEAVSENQFAVFLVANICTGLVNVSMRTLHASVGVGFFVIAFYMLAVTSFATIARYRKLKLKL